MGKKEIEKLSYKKIIDEALIKAKKNNLPASPLLIGRLIVEIRDLRIELQELASSNRKKLAKIKRAFKKLHGKKKNEKNKN